MSESCSECQNQQGRDNQIISSDEICEIILIVYRWKQFTWSLSSNLILNISLKTLPSSVHYALMQANHNTEDV